MIDAGLAMVQSLQALADQTTNKVMRDVIKDVCTRVEGGDSFSEALQKHPEVFNRLYVCMVAAGEKGGLLAEILARLALYLENAARLRKKVKSAMMYPTVVTVVAILITIFLLIKVVPVFGEIYSGFGADLPGPTQFLITLSNAVKHYIILFVLAGGGLGYGWVYFIKDKSRALFLGCPANPDCRFLDPLPTRFVWRASPAHWLRSFAAACPFWKCCRSSRKQSATSPWKRPSKRLPRTLNTAKAFPRHWPNIPSSPT